MVDSKKVAVLGFQEGVAGQVDSWFEMATGLQISCFVLEADDFPPIDVEAENRKRVSQRMEYPTKGQYKGRPFIIALDWAKHLKRLGISKVLPLTPDNRVRFHQLEVCHQEGFQLISAIHPSVIILPGATIQPGVWINAGSIIGYKSEIEEGVFINTGVKIDHHNVLKRCCQVDPGVVTAGNVTLRECSHVHTAATLINRVEIGEDAIVGAGAVVLDSVPPKVVTVGVPSKVIRHV
ncbi:MAG: acetyltransferase [Elusimicrobia bacterium]|nr:acetyltransferase [Elusimicrobiota bacterium]